MRRSRLVIPLLAALFVACPAAIALAVTDSPAPDTTIDAGPSEPLASSSTRFTFSSPEPTATFACRLDSAPFAPCASPQVLTGLTDGTHTFYARARNAAGVDPTPASRTFVVDTQAPPVTIGSGPSGPTNDPRPAFAFSSTDDTATFTCSIDTGTATFRPCTAAGTDQPATDLADGDYTFRVTAADAAGNSTTATRDFTVDTKPPDVSIDTGPTAQAGGPRPAFGFSSTDESATFQCSIDTGTPSFGPCSGDATDQPATDLADGSYTFRVQATDAAGNTATATREFEVTAGKQAQPAKRGHHRDAPHPVPAWYMTAKGAQDLRRQARSNACAFARRQSNQTRLLLMDFGKSEIRNHNWGAQLRTGPHFANQTILAALKAAAHSYRNHKRCYSRGSVRITYGNTNNSPGWMKPRNLRQAGRRQAKMAKRLQRYQRRQGYGHEGVAVAGDIEPQWSRPKDSKALVSGATRGAKGGLFFNYGAASGCPPEGKVCANHWDYRDLAKVSFGGIKKPLPEIYRPVHVKQWSKVRRRWDHQHRHHKFCFYGATATSGFPISIRQSWKRLRHQNDCVGRELVNIQEG
jgi:Big-like domain-containing protein